MSDQDHSTGSGSQTATSPKEQSVQEAGSGRDEGRSVDDVDDDETNENEGGDPRRDIKEYEEGQRPTKPDKG